MALLLDIEYSILSEKKKIIFRLLGHRIVSNDPCRNDHIYFEGEYFLSMFIPGSSIINKHSVSQFSNNVCLIVAEH
jgi:hypothetical protein